jgi:hypothetical protein
MASHGPPHLRDAAANWRPGHQPDRQASTHCCAWAFSERMNGPPRNLTFADAAEKVMNDDSGLSRVVTIDRDKMPAERLHLEVANRR